MEEKEQSIFEEFADLHIKYKDFKDILKMANYNNIKTFAELLMYCKVWGIKNDDELYIRLTKDFVNWDI